MYNVILIYDFKVQQLYDMMDLSEGIMLLGEPYGGKTMAWKILAASLKVMLYDSKLFKTKSIYTYL